MGHGYSRYDSRDNIRAVVLLTISSALILGYAISHRPDETESDDLRSRLELSIAHPLSADEAPEE